MSDVRSNDKRIFLMTGYSVINERLYVKGRHLSNATGLYKHICSIMSRQILRPHCKRKPLRPFLLVLV